MLTVEGNLDHGHKSMLIHRNLKAIPRSITSVVAMGSFDGVHIGHQELIKAIIDRARQLRASSVVMTFDPHPLMVLRPDSAPRILTPLPVKLRLFEQLGLEVAVVLPFTRKLAAQTPQNFVQRVLVDKLHVKEIHEGTNFRFGSSADGDVAQLEALGRKFGFAVKTHGLAHYGGERVSSSRIRQLVAEGHMDTARALLSQPFKASFSNSQHEEEIDALGSSE